VETPAFSTFAPHLGRWNKPGEGGRETTQGRTEGNAFKWHGASIKPKLLPKPKDIAKQTETKKRGEGITGYFLPYS